eukprot:Gb_36937 [translate_table: standard]
MVGNQPEMKRVFLSTKRSMKTTPMTATTPSYHGLCSKNVQSIHKTTKLLLLQAIAPMHEPKTLLSSSSSQQISPLPKLHTKNPEKYPKEKCWRAMVNGKMAAFLTYECFSKLHQPFPPKVLPIQVMGCCWRPREEHARVTMTPH